MQISVSETMWGIRTPHWLIGTMHKLCTVELLLNTNRMCFSLCCFKIVQRLFSPVIRMTTGFGAISKLKESVKRTISTIKNMGHRWLTNYASCPLPVVLLKTVVSIWLLFIRESFLALWRSNKVQSARGWLSCLFSSNQFPQIWWLKRACIQLSLLTGSQLESNLSDKAGKPELLSHYYVKSFSGSTSKCCQMGQTVSCITSLRPGLNDTHYGELSVFTFVVRVAKYTWHVELATSGIHL